MNGSPNSDLLGLQDPKIRGPNSISIVINPEFVGLSWLGYIEHDQDCIAFFPYWKPMRNSLFDPLQSLLLQNFLFRDVLLRSIWVV